jgi:predicted signal transduction protein with EAL and GGDEF domain
MAAIAKGRGRFSPYTSHVMGEGVDPDGRPGHIIGPAEIHTSQQDIHAPARAFSSFFQLNIMIMQLFCDWGTQIKPKSDSQLYHSLTIFSAICINICIFSLSFIYLLQFAMYLLYLLLYIIFFPSRHLSC